MSSSARAGVLLVLQVLSSQVRIPFEEMASFMHDKTHHTFILSSNSCKFVAPYTPHDVPPRSHASKVIYIPSLYVAVDIAIHFKAARFTDSNLPSHSVHKTTIPSSVRWCSRSLEHLMKPSYAINPPELRTGIGSLATTTRLTHISGNTVLSTRWLEAV